MFNKQDIVIRIVLAQNMLVWQVDDSYDSRNSLQHLEIYWRSKQ